LIREKQDRYGANTDSRNRDPNSTIIFGPRRKEAVEIAGCAKRRTAALARHSGDWNAKLSFDGPDRKGETNFSVNVR
jgi:hypothetical protein